MDVRKLSFALVLAAALLTGAASGQSSPPGKPGHKVRVPDDRSGTIIAKAESALEKKDFSTAESLLKEAVADDPQDYRAWFDFGFLYRATGRRAEAIAAYKKSLSTDPTLFEAALNLGLVLAEERDPEAEKYLRTATQLKPTARPNEGLGRAWLSLGHVIESKDSSGALAAYNEAAKLQPRNAEPHLSAGALLEQAGRTDEAEKEYRLAADLDPRSADAALGLVNIYQKSGRLAEADSALRKYIELEPGNPAAYFQLGRILAAEHKRYDAIDAYAAGLKLQPADLAAQRDLASLYDIAGKFDEAEAVWRSLLAAHSDDAEAHAGLGAVLLHKHKSVDAQQELVKAVTLNPKLGEAYSDLALAASENKNYQLAIRALDERAKLLSDNAGTYFLRATAYDNLHDHQRAAANYHQFLLVANGRFPDQEWQARHRLKAIETKK